MIVPQQKVVVTNNHGEKLTGLLHDTGSKEVVILCHGFGATKNDNIMANLAAALEAEGITAFRFDFSGNGESEGSFVFGNYMKEVDDLRAVVKHFVSANRTVGAIVGHSKGGAAVLLYASRYDDVHTVVNLSGLYKMERGLVEILGAGFMERMKRDGYIDVKNERGEVKYRVTEENLMEWLSTNLREACLNINEKCRVLTVQGSADEEIPIEDPYELSKGIPNHKVHIIDGSDHCYTSYQDELASVVKDFVKTGLQQDKESFA